MRTALAAKSRGIEAVIINADSAQVYADLRALSARPTEEEMQGIPHKLFGTWDGATSCSAPDWASAAKAEIAAAHSAEKLPILVGGTGLYMRTLFDGIAPIPAIDPKIREEVRAMPVSESWDALQWEDPARAAKLNAADTTRVARSLEVIRSTGKSLSKWQMEKVGGIGEAIRIRPAILMPEREWLYARCDLRFGMMMEQGAMDEVRALLTRNLDPALPVMRAIGVTELAALERGEVTREEAIASAAQATRNYAKRQFTWFRRQFPDDWPRIGNISDISASDIEILFLD